MDAPTRILEICNVVSQRKRGVNGEEASDPAGRRNERGNSALSWRRKGLKKKHHI